MFDLFSDTSASTFWLIVKVFLNLGLVILLIYTALSVARRLKLGTFGQTNKRLSLLETLYLAPKQKIHLVRIGKKILLIGATDDRLTVLTEEIDLESPEIALPDAGEVAEEKPSPLTWSPRTFWERWLAALNPRFNVLRHHTGE
jgi:flagellar biosynthetic protein FliO